MAEILVVAMAGEGTVAMVSLLRGAGYSVTVALDFKQAVALLNASTPDLLVSAIRLADYNGLHLVLRSQQSHPAMRAILIDHAHDALTETEAKRYGAKYLVQPVEDETLLEQVSLVLQASGFASPSRRWPRKKAADGLLAEIERWPSRVIDLSYGGLRFEVPHISEVPESFNVSLPGVGLVFQAKPVWIRRVASGWLSCGAELLDPSAQAADSWRRFVDAIPDQA